MRERSEGATEAEKGEVEENMKGKKEAVASVDYRLEDKREGIG